MFSSDNDEFELSHEERHACVVLIVEPNVEEGKMMHSALMKLGYGTIRHVNDHEAGIRALEQYEVTHVLFAAKETNLSAQEFLAKLLEHNILIVGIPTADHPKGEDVFGLLQAGAKGFLVKPISAASIDSVMLSATKGEPFSKVILQAFDRNEALSAHSAATLDRVANAYKQARDNGQSEKHADKLMDDFKQAVQLGRFFAEGGEERYFDKLIGFFVQVARDPKTRLGKLRKKLKHDRVTKGLDDEVGLEQTESES